MAVRSSRVSNKRSWEIRSKGSPGVVGGETVPAVGSGGTRDGTGVSDPGGTVAMRGAGVAGAQPVRSSRITAIILTNGRYATYFLLRER
jgi:hypothetical protein